MTLPYYVKENEISATYDKGVLELRLPRAEEAKTKKIEIKSQIPEGETRETKLKTKRKKN